MSNFRYRVRYYNCDGSTRFEPGNNYDNLSGHIDQAVDAGHATGGDIDEWVDGIGWVLCNEGNDCD